MADGTEKVRILSRYGHDRARVFGAAVAGLAERRRPLVIDGEIAAPDERGVTHLDDLASAVAESRTGRRRILALV